MQPILKQEQIKIINNDLALKNLCGELLQQEFIALDTEFVRTRTFYANLGLIQCYFGTDVFVIDPLKIRDFKPFKEVLVSETSLKIIHAASEDLEIFKTEFNLIPRPYMDTQIMAAFCGYGFSLGLNSLSQQILDIAIPKDLSRTDWLQRPLEENHLYYAAADVFYLLPLFYKLQEKLKDNGLYGVAFEEAILAAARFAKDILPEQAYLQFKKIDLFSHPIQLARLQILIQWRLQQAIKRNLPVNFVINEVEICNLAKNGAKTLDDLLEMELRPATIRNHSNVLLQLLQQVETMPEDKYPPKMINLTKISGFKNLYKKMQARLKLIVPENIAVEFLNSKKNLSALFKYCYGLEMNKPEILKGWRKAYGEQLQAEIMQDPSVILYREMKEK